MIETIYYNTLTQSVSGIQAVLWFGLQ